MKRSINRVCLPAILVLVIACGKNNNTGEGPDLTGKYVIPESVTDTVLFAESIDGAEIPVKVSIPENISSNVAGMVIMHGSGGNWKDEDTNNDGISDQIEEWTLSSQNRSWKNIFDAEGMVSAFPGSYYVRGTVENKGDWKNPPLQFQISASFIRNYDAYTALEVLQNLVRDDGTPIVQPDNVGLLGFSHGGTAVQSTIFDIEAVPNDWVWKQSFSGTTYTDEILPPAQQPEAGGFKTAVMYYPGSFHNSYYGNPCTGTSIYRSTIDFMIHLASEDPLTPNSQCMIETVGNNRGGTATVYEYQGAEHSFDNKSSGVDGEASTLARTRTMDFIRAKLGLE